MSKTFKDGRLLTKRLENKFLRKLQSVKRNPLLDYDSYHFDYDDPYESYEEPEERTTQFARQTKAA